MNKNNVRAPFAGCFWPVSLNTTSVTLLHTRRLPNSSSGGKHRPVKPSSLFHDYSCAPKWNQAATGEALVVFTPQQQNSLDITTMRRRPPLRRLIRNPTGRFFKAGEWTCDAREATIFPTVTDALLVRKEFGMEDITLVSWPDDFLDSFLN